jgi:DNA-binding IclR family transcriptional regulator
VENGNHAKKASEYAKLYGWSGDEAVLKNQNVAQYEKSMASKYYRINSVIRAAQILESFSLEKPTYTNSQLAKKLGLNKSSVTRLLYSLEEARFLRRDKKTGEYSLTFKLFKIGSVYINQIDFRSESKPLLSELASSFKETVHLAVLNDFDVFYIEKIETFQSIGMISRVGRKAPSYCTGVGKVMLAHLEEEKLKDFFRTVDLKRYTPNTITDLEELRLHLKRILELGYAIDDSEHEAEVKCVATPLRDVSGKVVAAISISGPGYRITRERMETELIPAIKRTAARISNRLGYVG